MRQFLFLILTLLGTISGFCQIVNHKYDTEIKKYGFVDANGNWVVKPIYESAYWIEKGMCGYVSLHDYDYSEANNTYAIINNNGKIITPHIYSDVYCGHSSKPIKVTQKTNGKEKYGVVNRDGREIVPCKYDECFITNLPIRCEVPYIEVTTIKQDIKYIGIYDWIGNILIPAYYKDIDSYHSLGNHIVQDSESKYGLYNSNFKNIITCQYDSIVCENNTAFIMGNGKWGAYSLTNEKQIVPIAYDSLFVTNVDDLVGFKRDGKYGYLTEEGEIIPPIYDMIAPFKNDVAKVTIDGKVTLLKNPLKDGAGIMIAENSAKKADKKKLGEPAVSRYPAPSSEVDSDIPVTKHKNDNRFAFIIANENYDGAPVPYALNDGRMFREYCTKALGVPEKHVRMYEDATFGNIIAAVEQVKEISAAYEGDVELIFYYAGHGVPDEKRNSAYLLPIDGNVSDIATTGYSLERLYGELANLNARNVTVFLDACFSGAKREDEMLLSGRGVAIKVKEEAPKGNMVVFSASTGDETAHQLADKTHGLFTYFLLKGIKDANGKVTLGALSDYVTKQVKRQSVVINNKRQTPTVIPSPSVTDTWRDLTL